MLPFEPRIGGRNLFSPHNIKLAGAPALSPSHLCAQLQKSLQFFLFKKLGAVSYLGYAREFSLLDQHRPRNFGSPLNPACL
ncbi:hypothetical protein [Pandoravirus japonicus]|uniref:Uncharacterized protein n=1 Tax=Pandoravirus japonicus TaxID=2823154 RepID=A0A811BPW2_9VIRU|nr:hypothetical protein [Pandoravirus japonicus]